MPLSIAQFVERLRESELLTALEVDTIWGAVPESKREEPAETLVATLVAGETLNTYQAAALLEGRGPRPQIESAKAEPPTRQQALPVVVVNPPWQSQFFTVPWLAGGAALLLLGSCFLLCAGVLIGKFSSGTPQTPPDKKAVAANPPVAMAPQVKPGESIPTKLGESIKYSLKMKLVYIPPGEFDMGSPDSEEEHVTNETLHHVRLTKGFYLGVYEVTQGEYEEVMGKNPSYFSATGDGKRHVTGLDTSRFPVENVSWIDATEFCRKLSAAEGRTYRLPTEAEWEYACRSKTKTVFHFGDVLNGEQANCDGNYPYGTNVKGKNLGRTTTVGSYAPNAFGLYDMHGNAWEWCSDWYADYAGDADDPQGPDAGRVRVLRGGSCFPNAHRARSASRNGYSPDFRYGNGGFRAARTP